MFILIRHVEGATQLQVSRDALRASAVEGTRRWPAGEMAVLLA